MHPGGECAAKLQIETIVIWAVEKRGRKKDRNRKKTPVNGPKVIK